MHTQPLQSTLNRLDAGTTLLDAQEARVLAAQVRVLLGQASPDVLKAIALSTSAWEPPATAEEVMAFVGNRFASKVEVDVNGQPLDPQNVLFCVSAGDLLAAFEDLQAGEV